MNAVLKSREQWLDERRTGIGGSDVAAILGLSPWTTPLDVYLDKIGEGDEIEDNAAMAWGRALEPLIRQAYEAATEREVFQRPDSIVHRIHGFMRANLDGEVLQDGPRVFEAKTARTGEGWGDPGTDQVPDAYALQVQWYMTVTGYKVADIAVLIGGSDFRIYTIEADPAIQNMLVKAGAAFWQRVQDRNPPEPQTFSEAQRAFGALDTSGQVEADDEAIEAHAALLQAKRAKQEAEDAEDRAKAVIARTLGDKGDTLMRAGKVLATWKLAKAPARFDSKRFAEAHPNLAAEFTAPGTPSRRLLLKD